MSEPMTNSADSVRKARRNLLAVNADADIEVAIAYVADLLCAAREDSVQNEAWTAMLMIEMAQGIVGSVDAALAEPNEGEAKTVHTPFLSVCLGEVSNLFSVNAGANLEDALGSATEFLGIAQPDAEDKGAWAAAYLIDMAMNVINSVAVGLGR